MTLSEAYEKAQEHDIVCREHVKSIPRLHYDKTQLDELLSRQTGAFSFESAIADDWMIIPAKKEHVSADVLLDRIRSRTRAEAWGTDDIEHAVQNRDLLYAIQISEENTHLLYVDLIEEIQSWIDSYQDRMPSQGIAVELCKELKKIKQHKEQDGNK